MNPLPPLPIVDGCLFIDNSSWIEGMSTCHRYLQYKSLNLRTTTSEKPSLNFGSSIHLALEYRYSLYGNKPVDQAYYDAVSTMLTEFYQQHPPESEDWRTLNWSMELVRKYNDRYDLEAFNLLEYKNPIDCPHCGGVGCAGNEDDKPEVMPLVCVWCRGTGKRNVMVELPFTFLLFVYKNDELRKQLTPEQQHWYDKHGGIKVMYSGRIDLPTLIDDKIFVHDHKTAASFTFGNGMNFKSFWDQMKMSAQQKGYCFALEELTGLKVAGYVVNGIRSSAPPQYVLSGGDSSRMSKGGTKKSAGDWWQESFQRERYLLKDGELAEWKRNTLCLVEEFFWHYSRGYMPMKTNWCTSFGRCPYWEVCTLHADDRNILLNSGLYTANTWSPLNQPTQPKQ